MTRSYQCLFTMLVAFSLQLLLAAKCFSQTELEPWGNLKGIRVDGQLLKVESNVSVVTKGWTGINATGKEKQRPKYIRKGNQQIVTTTLDSFDLTETAEDISKGNVTMTVQVTARSNTSPEGIFVSFLLPPGNYKTGSQPGAKEFQFGPASHHFTISFTQPADLIIKNGEGKSNKYSRLFIPVHTGDIQKGQTVSNTFTIKASGLVDRKPINLALNTQKTGRVFDGLGGNFRLQNPRTDPQVIDYCLANLNVTWARAEMPWRFWQPAIDTNPITAAKEGKLRPQVQRAMEIAQRLYKLGMPVILSAWSAPSWAIVGPPKFRPGPDGVWGNPLDQSKANDIYKSIADYMVYLKDQYGVEVSMFSFNESDLGINIRQTGEEHAALIKGLGAYFVSRGLHTKLLLGDNSDATTWQFIYPALNDPSTYPYIGAISFHSWRGWETGTLQKWADAATKSKLPLIVGEGSIDAQAWGYPAIFEEQTYALEEINLYTRLLAICQPAAILQWQLTADYSPLAGGGIFGDTRPLQPTQRFWNLKQLSATPKGLKAMTLNSDGANVSSAAVGDNDKGVYAFHLVNNGATRPVNLSGLPAKVKSLKMYVTDKKRSMKEGKIVRVVNGKATFTLDETSYTTLISQ